MREKQPPHTLALRHCVLDLSVTLLDSGVASLALSSSHPGPDGVARARRQPLPSTDHRAVGGTEECVRVSGW